MLTCGRGRCAPSGRGGDSGVRARVTGQHRVADGSGAPAARAGMRPCALRPEAAGGVPVGSAVDVRLSLLANVFVLKCGQKSK